MSSPSGFVQQFSGGGGGIRFVLDEYCRFTLIGSVTASVSATYDGPLVPQYGSGAGSGLTISLGRFIVPQVISFTSIDVHANGITQPTDNRSDSVSISGFLGPEGLEEFVLGFNAINHAAANTDGTATAQGSAELSVSFTVEPLGTRLVGLEVVQTIQDWNNTVPLIAGKPTYVRAHVEPISAAFVPIMNPRLRAFDAFGQELSGSPVRPIAESADLASPNAADPQRRANWMASVNFLLPQRLRVFRA